jgi:hypothetical protein
MNNREFSKSFLQLASSGQVQKIFLEYITEDFIHHNQYFKGDRDSLK